MNPVTAVAGFVPLVLFTLLDGRVPVGVAAAIAAVAAVVVFGTTVRRAVSALPIVQAVTLAAMSAIGFAGDPATRLLLTTYGRGIASLVVAAFILATVPVAPFTAAFARVNVPREHWHSPPFLSVNRRISTAWGLAVLVLGITHTLTAASGATPYGRGALLLDWGPTVVAVLLAFGYTRRTVAARTAAPVRR